jgi:hypothetical protein
MTRQEEIFLNQVAQGILPLETGANWFTSLATDRQQETLRWLAAMIVQAGARTEDVSAAMDKANLKRAFTPCVQLSKGVLSSQLAKVANLPAAEFGKAFQLLMALLSIADARRRETSCANGCSHWWHQELTTGQAQARIVTAEVA